MTTEQFNEIVPLIIACTIGSLTDSFFIGFIIFIPLLFIFSAKNPSKSNWLNTARTDNEEYHASMFISREAKLKHMQSNYWKQLKKDRMLIVNNKCEICGSTNNLNLHHISYVRLGQEDIRDVRILCGGINGCHQRQHNHYGYDRKTTYLPLV